MSDLDCFLASAPRKELLTTLIKLGGNVPYDAPNDVLAQMIKERVQFSEKTRPNTRKSSKIESSLDNLIAIGFFGVIILTIIILGIYFFFHLAPRKTSFCRTNEEVVEGKSRCVKCPSNANCSQGNATCKQGFRLIHRSCILDDGDAIFVSGMVEQELASLARQAGLFSCAYSDDESISRNDLIIELISKSRLKNADIEYLANKAVDHLAYENSIVKLNVDNEEFYVSKDLTRPLSCRVRIAISKHLKFWASLALVLAVIAYSSYKKRAAIQRKLRVTSVTNVIYKMYGQTKVQFSSNYIIQKVNEINPQPDDVWRDVFTTMAKNQNCDVFPSGNGYMVKFK